MANFCGKCGRKLEPGEVCNCTAQSAAQTPPPYQQMQYRDVRQEQGQNVQQEQSQNTQQERYRNAQQGPQGQFQYNQQGPQGQFQQNQQGPQGQFQYNQQGPYYQNMNMGNPGGQYYQGPGGPGGMPYGGNGGYQQDFRRTREYEWLNNKKDAFVGVTKNMFSEILPILKAPVTRVTEIARTNTMAVGLEFIVTKMAVFIILALLLIFKALAAASSEIERYGLKVRLNDYVDIPYLQIILMVIILTIGIDFLRALIQKGIANAFGGRLSFNASVTIVGAGAMFQSIFGAIGGLIALLLPLAGIVIISIGFGLAPFIEYSGYMAVVDGKVDRNPYAYFIVTILTVIVTMAVIALLGSSAVDTLSDLVS